MYFYTQNSKYEIQCKDGEYRVTRTEDLSGGRSRRVKVGETRRGDRFTIGPANTFMLFKGDRIVLRTSSINEEGIRA